MRSKIMCNIRSLPVSLTIAMVICQAVDGSKVSAAQAKPETSPADAKVAASRPTSQAATSRPATSQPASEIVLIRFGDEATITQADFEAAMQGIDPEKYDAFYDLVMGRLYQSKLLWLYIQDHPDLVTEEEVDAAVEKAMKKARLKTLQELENRLMERSGTTMEGFRERKRFLLARTKLTLQGIEKGKDEAFLKDLYEKDPSSFNSTRVTASHILIRVQPYETPAQRKAKHDRLAKIREDLVSGKRTWEECLEESECRTKFIGGRLGRFTRYLNKPEPIAKTAFSLKVDELSDIVESNLGFHLIKLTGRTEGTVSFEKAKRQMQVWLQQVPFMEAIEEVKKNHPVVGIRSPARPAQLSPQNRVGTTTQPASTQPASTQAASTRRGP